MTWTAVPIVTNVSEVEPGLFGVTAVARAEETYVVGLHIAHRVTSNTEGVIEEVEVSLMIRAQSSPLAVGDELTGIYGHFSRSAVQALATE